MHKLLKQLKQLSAVLLFALLCSACNKAPADTVVTPQINTQAEATDNSAIEQAYAHKKSNIQVSGSGVVVKLLADDSQGLRHQKFLVKINPRQTLLFAHNIDLAERIPLHVGDELSFSGEYVYNPKGGIMHWTHLDPHGHHPSGWIMLHGHKYQ